MLNLEQSERILLEVRRHWFVFSMENTILFLMAIIPLFIATILGIIYSFSIPLKVFILIAFTYCLYLSILWVFFFLAWTDYYLDFWLITNQKIFHIEQKGLFKRQESIFLLEKIQDITVDVSGVFATLLGFGDIHVQTAGQGRKFIIYSAFNPYQVEDLISGIINKNFRKKKDHYHDL